MASSSAINEKKSLMVFYHDGTFGARSVCRLGCMVNCFPPTPRYAAAHDNPCSDLTELHTAGFSCHLE